jgi:hypothetical protein
LSLCFVGCHGRMCSYLLPLFHQASFVVDAMFGLKTLGTNQIDPKIVVMFIGDCIVWVKDTMELEKGLG